MNMGKDINYYLKQKEQLEAKLNELDSKKELLPTEEFIREDVIRTLIDLNRIIANY